MTRPIPLSSPLDVPIRPISVPVPTDSPGERVWETDGDRGHAHDWESEGGTWIRCPEQVYAPAPEVTGNSTGVVGDKAPRWMITL